MFSSLIKALPILASMAVVQVILYIVDNKFKIIDRINSKVPIRPEWKAFFWYILVLLFIIGITLLKTMVLNIPAIIYMIINGLIIGFGVNMAIRSMARKN